MYKIGPLRTGFLIHLFIFLIIACKAQTAPKILVNPYIKTGCYSRLHADVFSFSANQAMLAQVTQFAVGVFSERKFMLEDLSSFSASMAVPTASGVFGLQVQHFGTVNYAQMQTGLAYGRKLSEKIDAALQFNYYNVRINGYGNAANINVEGGVIFHISEQFNAGIHLYNPASLRLSKSDDAGTPAVYTLGLGYDVSKDFFISTEIEKAEGQTINVHVGLEYLFSDRLRARGGVTSGSSIVFFGLGVQLDKFRLDITSSIHPQLGITPGLQLIFTKKDKK